MQRKRFILYSKQQGNALKFIVTQFHLLKPKMPYTNCTLKQFSESSQNSNIKFKNESEDQKNQEYEGGYFYED